MRNLPQGRLNGERDVDLAVAPEAGLAAVFRQPPEELLYHDGEELRRGVKYLLRTDVMYRKVDAFRAGLLERDGMREIGQP